MSQFPIIKWINVDGRGVPFAYPQHEKLDGSFTETGEKNPLPTKDADLKAELELIKAQQKQILERLDNPINTQLTGSNVEEILDRDITITAGSRYDSREVEFIGIKTGIAIRFNTRTKFTISVRPMSTFSNVGGYIEIFEGDSYFANELIENKTRRYVFRVENNGLDDAFARGIVLTHFF